MHSGSSGSVIVVEDSTELRELLSDALRDLGWRVVEFATGTSVLEFLCAGGTADVLLLDLVLKADMSGWQLLELLRVDARFRSLPVIAVTGAELREPERTRLASDAILNKPFEMAQLTAMLARFRPPGSVSTVSPTSRHG